MPVINLLRVGIAGAGRMGLSIADLIAVSDDLESAGIWTRHPDKLVSALLPESAYVGSDPQQLVAQCDVLIDFSLPDGTERILSAAVAAGVPLVCGVSGLSDEQQAMVLSASASIPLVYDRNMSQGIAVLTRLVSEAASALGPDFDVRIEETHHVNKKDAPSGTALKLGESIAAARGRPLKELMHFVPEADGSAPPAGQIDFRVERHGEVPGDHAVHFTSDSEHLSLSHSVKSREVFARGAVSAARWVVGQAAGLYSMDDVLFGEKSGHI
jgi:4-hydroxy-tetrahydrodipicolinate reductase